MRFSEGGAALRAPVNAAPFDLAGEGRCAALCLHGLTGTPYEVRPLGEALAVRGVRAVGPVLPGHNLSPEVLAGVPHGAWVQAARAELRTLRAHHARVAVVGLSMGGLLALLLAAEEEVDAVVVVGTPLRFGPLVRWLVPLVKHLRPFAPKRGGSDIRHDEARAIHPSYTVMPLAAVHELQRLQRRVRDCLECVTAPILVAHGAHDRTARVADSRRIVESVASEECELLILDESAHIVPVDHDGERLAEAAAEWVARYTGRG